MHGGGGAGGLRALRPRQLLPELRGAAGGVPAVPPRRGAGEGWR